MIKNAFNWWIGCIEDRKDPERLGRARVRILGLHTEDTSVLPTTDLPWAIIMQPTTSAAVSGIGSAPVGLMQGTWVVGFFLDGDDMQQPMIMGTLGATPVFNPRCSGQNSQVQQDEENPPNAVRSSDGQPVVDSQGNPIVSEPVEQTPTNTSTAIASELPPLTKEQIQKLMDAIGFKESSSVAGGRQNYSAQNQLNYIGKYQFGAPALATLGYVKIPSGGKLTNSVLNDPASWTGKDGLTSKDAFFKSSQVQESIMFQNLKFNYNVLLRNKTITTNDSAGKVSGLLAVAHLLGAGGATNFAKGTDSKDGNGVTGNTYYEVGAKAVGNDVPVVNQERPQIAPDKDPAGSLNDASTTGEFKAFQDPDLVFPKCDYVKIKHPDTHKLAVGFTVEDTAIEKRKNSLRQNISTVTGAWDEPVPAYCASYPFNQTYETEAGHLIELDNTPGQERIHLFHKNGSYIEIDVNGSMIRKTLGDNYEIIEHNNYMYCRGAYNLTIDGATQVLIKNDVNLHVYGTTNATFNNDVNMKIAGETNIISGEAFNIKAKSFNVDTDEQFNIFAGTEFNVTAGGDFNVQATNTSIDGGDINLNSGLAQSISSNGLGAAPSMKDPETTDPNPLQRPDCSKEAFTLDAGEEGSEEIRQQQIKSGNVVPTQPTESGEATAPTQTNAQQVNCDCTEFASFKTFPDTIVLSKYFNLGQLSSRAAVVKDAVTDQRGLTKPQIVCNLKNLAVNCLDKIKDKYPDMFVTNAFRLGNNSSDHGIGMAADLQFTKAKPSDYFEIAQWIAANIPYKQLLLEYGGGARNPWIHIAFDKSGQKHPLPYATFKDHQVYARNKFVNLA